MWLLGIGTPAGSAVQALALIPFVREAGCRFRPQFDWRGTGLCENVHAAKWTLLLVLTDQVPLSSRTTPTSPAISCRRKGWLAPAPGAERDTRGPSARGCDSLRTCQSCVFMRVAAMPSSSTTPCRTTLGAWS
ncbi:hypothetical protein AB0D84_21630 [Streptomyces sp. NPDC048193]|uniref:hypothetical protein n=1 Tax=Streptomyces sp. NPDC048193 TaxID=3155630 RepID=UPI0034446EEC